MCLCLKKNFEEETKIFRNSSEKLIGYKLFEKIDDQTFKSFFYELEYKLNEIAVSDRISVKLTKYEIKYFQVSYGLHFYKYIQKDEFCKTQNKFCPRLWCNAKVEICKFQFVWGKFEIDPKNLVAVGEFNGYESFVADKAKLVEIIEKI